MKIKKPVFFMAVLALGALMICLIFSGCGGGSSGSGVTIRGQVVINGEPAGSDKVSHYVLANGKTYGGDVISTNGYFSHGRVGLDQEFCIPGCTVTILFVSTDTMAFKETYVYEYVVQDGDNNLGQIDLGLYGFSLVSPENEAKIGPDIWPPQFQWTAYERMDLTPEYRLNLRCDLFVSIEKTTKDTSVILDGDETVTVIYGTYDLKNVQDWTVYVEYQQKNHTIRHWSETRNVGLIPPEE
jgi:hypothetical protein